MNYAKMHAQGLEEQVDSDRSSLEDGQIMENESPFRVMASEDEYRADEMLTETTSFPERTFHQESDEGTLLDYNDDVSEGGDGLETSHGLGDTRSVQTADTDGEDNIG